MIKVTTGYPLPQGCTVRGENVNFSVCVPSGKKCELLLYKKGKKVPEQIFDMQETGSSGLIRCIALRIPRAEAYEYNYRVDGEIVIDSYARAFAGRKVWGEARNIEQHEVRARIIDTEFPWEDDKRPHLAQNEVIAYSLHVRGFTKHSSSKVRYKGTFAGVLEKLPYLKDLGVNQIHVMPIYDFEENKSYLNYWGYGEGYYFAPKSSYAAKEEVTELKNLIKTLHSENMELILEMPFTGDTPKMMILGCLRFWVMEYHIDGFILNPCIIDRESLINDPVLYGTKIMKKMDDFQNTMRRFLKGDEGMVPGVMWWLRHQSEEEETFNYITGQTGFTLNDLVSYDQKHNEENGEENQDGPDYNFSWNCSVEGPTRKRSVVELRRKQIYNAFFLLLLAQGTPCILAGDEFANSQKGNNNVYCQDNPVSWLDWSKLQKEEKLHQFVKDLIAFRKAHKVLHPEHEMMGIDSTSCGIPDISYHSENAWQTSSEVSSRQIGVFYHGSDEEESCYVAYNMHWVSHLFALPALPKGKHWYLAASTDDGVLKEPVLIEEAKCVEVEERTIKVFIVK